MALPRHPYTSCCERSIGLILCKDKFRKYSDKGNYQNYNNGYRELNSLQKKGDVMRLKSERWNNLVKKKKHLLAEMGLGMIF